MSLLPPDVHAAILELLNSLKSADNTLRAKAEEVLNSEWVQKKPDVLLMALAEQILASEDSETRSFAAVLFRRIANKPRKVPTGTGQTTTPLFISLPEAERNAIREKLLQAFLTEKIKMVLNKISDAVAEVARQHTEEASTPIPWPELLQALFQASRSPEPVQREAAFRIFKGTPGIIEKQHEDIVIGAFNTGFKDSDASVRLAAMEAFAAFFRELSKKNQSKYFGLVGDILNILPPLKESNDSEELSRGLMSLIEMAEFAPRMFKVLFNSLVKFSIAVIQEKELTDATRQNALELMSTFAEHAPNMCRKDPDYVNDMVTQCLSLMTDVGIDDDDASEWAAVDDLEVDDSEQNHVAGEQTMDRLANRLGGDVLLPPTFNWLPRMMTSSAWRDRHAALMAISAISEGCRDLMVGELDKVLELVVPALSDAHPRVRWAGCNALGQMSTDFAGTMQEKYHSVVLPAIIPVLNSPEPRVQSHAAAALVNFCEEAEKEVLEPYLDPLLANLLGLLQSPKRFVQEQALSTIATVADSAESAFGNYYNTLMPLLFTVLKGQQAKEYRLLRAKAMECATLIALAIGKQRMGTDALELVQLLQSIQQSITEADDPQAQYLLHCWGRMCRVLEQDFVPFLPIVMGPLLEMAASKPDIQLLDEEEVDKLDQEEGWELVPLKGRFIGIKTSVLDDKNTAIELINIYAEVLREAFEPYVIQIMDKVAIPSLAFFFHDPVRVSAAKCVPILLSSYKKAHVAEPTALGALWQSVIEKVLEVLSTEPAIETLAEMYTCFFECVDCMGKNCLTNSHMETFVTAAEGVLKDFKIRVIQRQEEAKDGDDEEEDEQTQEAIEDDQTLLSSMNKAIHGVFKNHGSTFLPYFDVIVNYCAEFATAHDPTQRQWAICIYDDVLEYCDVQSARYSDRIVTPVINGLSDDFAANRQAAAYGVGVMAQKGGQSWTSVVAQCLPLLFQVCQRPNARDEDDIYATENACASIAKVLHYMPAAVGGEDSWQKVADVWIDTLPIVNDEEAAPYGYSFLTQLIESNNPAVLAKAPQCFKAVAEALNAENLKGQTAERTISASKQLVTTANLNADQLLASLDPDVQQTVRRFFG